jgi:hypothetical protein
MALGNVIENVYTASHCRVLFVQVFADVEDAVSSPQSTTFLAASSYTAQPLL